jgi:hypothetical protein
MFISEAPPLAALTGTRALGGSYQCSRPVLPNICRTSCCGRSHDSLASVRWCYGRSYQGSRARLHATASFFWSREISRRTSVGIWNNLIHLREHGLEFLSACVIFCLKSNHLRFLADRSTDSPPGWPLSQIGRVTAFQPRFFLLCSTKPH